MPLVDTSRDLTIVAHQDDDLLFMNPDIQASIDAGNEVTTLYITAGDAGEGEAYWSGREQGIKNAYAAMAATESEWIDTLVTLSHDGAGYQINSSALATNPDIRLYFLRLPDGGENGLPRYNFESLIQLNDGRISSVTSVDGASTYARVDVIGAIGAVLEHHQPDQIRVQDHQSEFAPREHRDHLSTAIFSEEALATYSAAQFTVTSYVHYGSVDLRANLVLQEQQQTLETFQVYAEHDQYVFVDDGTLNPLYLEWAQRQYVASEVTTTAAETNSISGAYTLELGGTGIAGARVYLYDAIADQIIATATTTLDGEYKFHDIPIGATYRILFQDPASLGGEFLSYNFSPRTNDMGQPVDHDVTNIVDEGVGATAVFSIAEQQEIVDIDAAIYDAHPSTIAGFYFVDEDANGSRGAHEAGIAGALVTLFDGEALTDVATTVTDTNGHYDFGSVPPESSYQLTFEGPETLGPSFSGHRFDFENSAVSTVDPTGSGLVSGVNIALGTSTTEINASLVRPETPSISGRVFADSNANGLNDVSEAGITGMTVSLINVDIGEVVATTLTDPEGDYLFSDVIPNQSYTLRFDASSSTDPSSLSHNFGFSTLNIGDDGRINSDVATSISTMTGDTDVFTISETQTIRHIDAGRVAAPPASISGRYFVDHNNNRVDDGSFGLANATVTLFQGAVALAVANTNSRGEYFFDGIAHGDDFFVMIENPDFVTETQTNGFSHGDVGQFIFGDIISHITGNTQFGNGRTETFSLSAGQDLEGFGAGVANFLVPWAEDGMLGG